MAAYAERNGYPGPKHILELEGKLNLSDEQMKQIEAIYEEMLEKARIKGKEVVEAELRLDELFSAKSASEESIRSLATQIGWLRGELRAIHLLAHLQASVVLTPEQSARYGELRHGDKGHH
jgi:Spy/CpxP family protein refolding chaperone